MRTTVRRDSVGRVRGDPRQAVEVLDRAGVSHGEVLGVGVEGVVVALDSETVAKVWVTRSRDDLELLKRFYAAIDAHRPSGSPIEFPHIVDVVSIDGTLVSVERRLTGTPLWVADGSSPLLTASSVDAMTEVLAALARIPAAAGLFALPMLPDGEPPFDPAAAFEAELADLVTRRVARFEIALATACPDLDRIAAGTVTALRRLTPASRVLVHGDLIAANVLTAGGRASAVLDFGFLSTAGDPAFDAAISASCFDMWGPRSRDVERELDDAFAAAFGYGSFRVAVYRAAYALVTACCFGTDLSEGHFAWCMDMLARPDVRDAVGA